MDTVCFDQLGENLLVLYYWCCVFDLVVILWFWQWGKKDLLVRYPFLSFFFLEFLVYLEPYTCDSLKKWQCQQKLLGFLRIPMRQKKNQPIKITIKIESNWKTLQVFKKFEDVQTKMKMEMNDWLIFIGPFECFQKKWKNCIFSLVPYVTEPQNRMIRLHENFMGSSFIFFSLHFKEVWLH